MQDGPGRPAAGFKVSQPFEGAAGNVGTPSALPANSDGTIAWAGRKVNRPTDTMQDDLAAASLDFRTERGAGANDLPILSQEHGHGSIKAVVFAGPDPKGNREALGVGNLSKDASLIERREQSRRAAVAHGCRSQAYTQESEFNGAAGQHRQVKVHEGVAKNAPFGVDGDSFPNKYETSSSAGPGSWDQSMASRIARRRLTGRQPRSPTGGSTAMVAQ